jgi:hypothetical protein
MGLRQLSFLLFLLCMPGIFYAQDKSYSYYIRLGEQYYIDSQYLRSAHAYAFAFAVDMDSIQARDEYNAACSWALAGKKDTAFYMLDKAATAQYNVYNHTMMDPDLQSLHDDPQWLRVTQAIKYNRDKPEMNNGHFNEKLVAVLDTVFQDDQGLRLQEDAMEKKYKPNSKEIRDIWRAVAAKDSIDLIKVSRILNTYGWLGPDIVGGDGSVALFAVIQHSDLKTQEKYLPMMRKAVEEKEADAGNFALLEDRVALREGKKQIYGSQISMDSVGNAWVAPLEDPDNVDKRRASVGLGPLADYVKYWNLTWNVEAYKKQLPAIEAKSKRW